MTKPQHHALPESPTRLVTALRASDKHRTIVGSGLGVACSCPSWTARRVTLAERAARRCPNVGAAIRDALLAIQEFRLAAAPGIPSDLFGADLHAEAIDELTAGADPKTGEWHSLILLKPLESEFPPIEIVANDEEETWVIASFVEVLR